VSPENYRRLRNQLNRGMTSQKAAKLDMARILSRSEDLTRAIVSMGLTGSENFSVCPMGPSAADRLAELLGQEVKVGVDVVVDGHWTDDVKEFVFTLLPSLVTWLDNEIDELSELQAEEEDALGKI
jgi:hypothetical protein